MSEAPTPVTPAAPAAPTTPQPETYDAQGHTVVDDNMFLTEDERTPAGEPSPANPSGDQPTPPTPPEPDKPLELDDKDPMRQSLNPDAIKKVEPPPAAPQPPAAPPAPKLLAGKYASVEQLQDAFVNLGGDPSHYDTPEKLEEAYSVRQQEYNRSRQQFTQNQPPTPTPLPPPVFKDPQQIVSDILSNTDFSKVKNATEMGAALVSAFAPVLAEQQRVFQEQLKATQVDPTQLAQTLQEREAVLTEIRDLETEVPRLRYQTDEKGQPIPNPFRDSFAAYVKGLKGLGTYTGMKDAMRTFISPAQSVAAETAKKAAEDAAAKKAATTTQPPDGGASPVVTAPNNSDEDVVGGILQARKEHIGKFGY